MNDIFFGIVGAGYAARLHAEAYRKISGVTVRLKYITDLDYAKAQKFQKAYACEKVAVDLDEILADPQIDVVDICTPPSEHLEMAEKIFLAGKHVICEKPLTGYFGMPGDPTPVGTSVAKSKMLKEVISSLERLSRVWKQSGKKFCYAENYVYAPSIQKAIELVTKKQSKILFLKGEESLKGSGSLNTGEWSAIGGGALIRAGVHPLSSVLALKREEARARGEKFGVKSVLADMGMVTKILADDYEHRHIRAFPNDVEDYAVVSLTFLDGTKASLTASDLVLGGTKGYVEVYTNDSAIHCNVSPVDLVKSYFLDEDRLENVSISEMLPGKLGWNAHFVADETIRGFLGELQDFVTCIAEDREPFSDLALACWTIQIVYAAYQSAEEGRKIEISLEE